MQGQPFTIPARSGRRATAAAPSSRARGPHTAGGGFVVPFFLVLLLAYLASADTAFNVQVALSVVTLLVLFALRLFRQSELARVGFLVLSTFVILRYFFWRTLHTVEFTDWVSFTCAVVLYLAELYGILVALIGNVVNLAPLEREAPPLPSQQVLPSVDVFIPTYNEPLELLETTLIGAVQMRYQEGRKKIYLLDDGGTDEKCERGTEASIKAARERRATLQNLCIAFGAIYLTRPRNRGAKAGNINEGMSKTSGELVVIFDADHVPTEDFLEKTIGFFVEDPKLFLVQTPHFFINPDPVERNLDTFDRMPAENEMFYRVIQKGLDFWNSAFFCGSGAVMRRSCLELIGGISGSTITEDAETALILHSRGYNSVYLSRPLLSGLAAETMSGFIGQRSRWAQGMTQLFLLKCPLFLKGLTLAQRFCYFNSCFFWLFPFARLIYMLAPAAFLIFGLRIYAANVETFCAFAIPYLLTMALTSNFLYGKARWSFISELYELIQCVHTIPAILATIISPRSPTFKVTPKLEQLDDDFISPLAPPFYILALINIGCIVGGIYSLLSGHKQTYAIVITLFWSLFNTVILLATLGALFERRQRRATPRVDAGIDAELALDEHAIACQIVDVSVGGGRLNFRGGDIRLLENTSRGVLRVPLPGDALPTDFHVEFRNYRGEPGGDFSVGVRFAHRDLAEKMAKVRLVSGNSYRWEEIQKSKESSLGITGAFLSLTVIGFSRFLPHFVQMWANFFGITSRERKLQRGSVNA